MPQPPLARQTVAVVAYNGVEQAENGCIEEGYLEVEVGDSVELLAETSEGHTASRYPRYVFARRLRASDKDMTAGIGTEGWLPEACVELWV